MKPQILCRCCGREVHARGDNFPIHTRCIVRHWGNHSKGRNATRCQEFKPSAKAARAVQRRQAEQDAFSAFYLGNR